MTSHSSSTHDGLTWHAANNLIAPASPTKINTPPPFAAPSTFLVITLLILDGIDGWDHQSGGTVAVFVISCLLTAAIYGVMWICTLRLLPFTRAAFTSYIIDTIDIRKWFRAELPSRTNQPDEPQIEEDTYEQLPGDTDEDESSKSRQLPLSAYPCYRRSKESSSSGRWYMLPSSLLCEGDMVGVRKGSKTLEGCPLRRLPKSSPRRLSVETAFFHQHPNSKTFRGLSPSLTALINGGELEIMVLCGTVIKARARASEKSKETLSSRQRVVVRGLLVKFTVVVFLVACINFTLTSILTSRSIPVLRVIIQFLVIFLSTSEVVSLSLIAGLTEVVGLTRTLKEISAYRSEYYAASDTSSSTDANDSQAQQLPPTLPYELFLAVAKSRLLRPHTSTVLRRSTSDKSIANATALQIPPASLHVVEKLATVSCVSFVDDDLICSSSSCEPQQILLPTTSGLKLLDISRGFGEDDDDDGSDSSDDEETIPRTHRSSSFDTTSYAYADSSSDSEDEKTKKGKKRKRRWRKNKKALHSQSPLPQSSEVSSALYDEMEFDDPRWWEHLPSLKGIGLAALILEVAQLQKTSEPATTSSPTASSLLSHLSKLPHRRQLLSVASCIGFDVKNAVSGRFSETELHHFKEKLRIHFIHEALHKSRVDADYHALGLEEARFRGRLVPHVTSVVVQDDRSDAFQLLSVGEAELSVNNCSQLWQGETSTIIPMSAFDRKNLLDTAKNWILEDLNVVAFTYSPVPYAFEDWRGKEGVVYLVHREGGKGAGADTSLPSSAPPDDVTDDDYWNLTKNHVFLGLLGSTSGPRKSMVAFISKSNSAGIRFVYFSPRNMRRSKELASKLGLEMGWNCAISLRALESDQDHDEHRMISAYADWDVNAKLPHGIEEIRTHLVDVDNVPLLVSLFTDATYQSTRDMVTIFREHNDTVLVLGCSHHSKNMKIFESSDICVGVDVYEEEFGEDIANDEDVRAGFKLASSVITQDCLFSIPVAAIPNILNIVGTARACHECSISASQFILSGTIGMSTLALLCLSTPDSIYMYISGTGAILYLLFLLPALAVGIAWGGETERNMKICPIKNNVNQTFPGRNELWIRSSGVVGRGVMNAVGGYLAGMMSDGGKDAGIFMMLEFSFATIISSVGSCYRSEVFWVERKWMTNVVFVSVTCMTLLLVLILLFCLVEVDSPGTGGWIVFTLWPFFDLFLGELLWKRREVQIYERAALLRRLAFETRLGMWSPR